MFILDQGLGQRGFAMQDIDQIVDDAAFASHDQIEVAQADVEIDDGGFMAAQREAGGKAGAGSGFADAPFTGGHDDDSCHGGLPSKRKNSTC